METALIDCEDCAESELFVVEGPSAANAVRQVRDRQYQAILPMQGKIPNAAKTPLAKISRHVQVADLLQSVHPRRLVEIDDSESIRYRQVVLLNDPDIDGVHAGLLLVLFFLKHLPYIIERGQLYLVHAPLFGIYSDSKCIAQAVSERQLAGIRTAAEKQGISIDVRRFKGVASIDPPLLTECLKPDSAARRLLTISDCTELTRQFS